VVDDDPVVRSQLVRLYTHSGYTVVPVGSAEDALKQLADGNIDFVITDIKLPGLDGGRSSFVPPPEFSSMGLLRRAVAH
jgi:CheY-like chemotaxis protein